MVHEVAGLVGQRMLGIALGYEDLNDHDQLRRDPVMAHSAAGLRHGAPIARRWPGKSTLNRLELSREEPTRCYKISHDAAAIEGLFVDLSLNAHTAPTPQITLDLDATDDPLHGHQEGVSFTAITTPTAICRFMCSRPASGTRWRGGAGGREAGQSVRTARRYHR